MKLGFRFDIVPTDGTCHTSIDWDLPFLPSRCDRIDASLFDNIEDKRLLKHIQEYRQSMYVDCVCWDILEGKLIATVVIVDADSLMEYR